MKINHQKLMNRTFIALAFMLSVPLAYADPPIVVSGVVKDPQVKQAILAKVTALYGPRVVDQIKIANVQTPPMWSEAVLASITPDLRNITQGRLSVNGPIITVDGNVTSETTRSGFDSRLAVGLPAAYRIRNTLNVVAPEQTIVDKALADKVVEFQSGKAELTPIGLGVLDGIAIALKSVGNKQTKITGYTDNQGVEALNIKLSKDRADAVKQYLIGRGIRADLMTTFGLGSQKPVASNDTEEGRKRNRRIVFTVL